MSVYLRGSHSVPGFTCSGEESQARVGWREHALGNCKPDAVQHVVAMGFDQELNPSGREAGEHTACARLGLRVEMGFRTINHDDIAGLRREQGDNDREDVGETVRTRS